MWPGCVVKLHVLFKQAVDVLGTDGDDVVQQFHSQRAVKPFHHTVLPRTTHAGSDDLDAHAGQQVVDQGQKDRVVVHQHLLGSFVKRVGIPDLLCHPFTAWVVGGPAHYKLTTLMVYHVQNVEQLAPPIKGDLEVHGCHGAAVIA